MTLLYCDSNYIGDDLNSGADIIFHLVITQLGFFNFFLIAICVVSLNFYCRLPHWKSCNCPYKFCLPKICQRKKNKRISKGKITPDPGSLHDKRISQPVPFTIRHSFALKYIMHEFILEFLE